VKGGDHPGGEIEVGGGKDVNDYQLMRVTGVGPEHWVFLGGTRFEALYET